MSISARGSVATPMRDNEDDDMGGRQGRTTRARRMTRVPTRMTRTTTRDKDKVSD